MLDWFRRRQESRRADEFADQAIAALESGASVEKSYASLFARGLEHLMFTDKVTSPVTQIGTVYVAIRAIATNGASFDWGLFDGEEELDGPDVDQFRDLLSMPDAKITGREIFERTLIYLECSGDAFWIPDAEARTTATGPRRPTSIQLIKGDRMEPVLRGQDLVSWRLDGRDEIPDDRVIQFSYPHPDNPWRGLAPLRAARLGYNIQWKSQRWQELFFDRGGVPPFWVKMPDGVVLTPDERERMREHFRNQYHRGLTTVGEVPMMARGATLESISVNQRDAEWLATQNKTTEDILAIFGVPKVLAGYPEDSNRSISETELRIFWTSLLPPKLHTISSVLNTSMVPAWFGGRRVEFRWKIKEKLAEALPEDVRQTIDAAKKLCEMGYPASVATRFLGLDVPNEINGQPIPGLDDPYKPSAMLPVAHMDAPDAPPPADVEPVEDRAVRRGHTAAAREAIKKAHVRELEKWEREMLGVYRGFLRWLRGAVLDNLPQFAGKAPPDDPLPPKDEMQRQLFERTKRLFQRLFSFGFDDVSVEVGRDLAFDFLDPAVQRALSERRQKLAGVTDTLAQKLRELIFGGIEEGETENELRERVLDFFGDDGRTNARTIARTETSAAFLSARELAMLDAGVERHEWFTARDEKVRHTHQELDGAVARIGTAAWEKDGETISTDLRRPHDPAAPPGEVINCRCKTVAVIDGADDA